MSEQQVQFTDIAGIWDELAALRIKVDYIGTMLDEHIAETTLTELLEDEPAPDPAVSKTTIITRQDNPYRKHTRE